MPIKVSASEALALSCERKWMYAFHEGYHLEAKKQGVAISRGLLGHAALEIYYQEIMAGNTDSYAQDKVTKFLMQESIKAMQESDADRVTTISDMLVLLQGYFKSESNRLVLNHGAILGVEYDLQTYLDDDIILPGRLDLLINWLSGPYKGETISWDHKFVYNFWSDNAFMMNAQIPGYTHLIKQNFHGVSSPRGLINQIRHRKNAQDVYKVTPIPTPRVEVDAIIENHLLAAHKIKELRKTPVEELKKTAKRSISKYNCENCSFLRLCKTELRGGDTTTIRKYEYRDNSYGYGNVEEEEV